MLGDRFAGLGWPALMVGLALHAWGMADRHRLEAGAPAPAWSTALYWICWVALAAVAAWAALQALGVSE